MVKRDPGAEVLGHDSALSRETVRALVEIDAATGRFAYCRMQ
jgi:hypothetical protein